MRRSPRRREKLRLANGQDESATRPEQAVKGIISKAMTNFPKTVVSRLAGGEAAAGSHPDANLLSAFAEHLLADADRLHVLAHLAQCSECREIVWLATPPVEAANVVPQKISVPWFSWPILRWGAAIACVVVVGTAITLRQREVHSPRPATETSVPVSAQPATPPEQDGTTSPVNTHASPAVAQPSTSASIAQARQAPTDLRTAPMARMAMQPAAPQAQINLKAQASPSADKTNDLLTKNEIDSLVPGRAKDALDEAPADAGNMALANGPLEGESAPITAKRLLVPASTMAPRWTLTAEGTLQRSIDLGRTWQPITIPAATGVSLRALAANGLDIWVGGTSGTLYHSADAGQHWTRVQPVYGGQQLSADIIGVEFPDADHGRLNTSSGEVWTTEDAGSSWEKH
jgi:hypothetical protein